jgi:hypothetical protein
LQGFLLPTLGGLCQCRPERLRQVPRLCAVGNEGVHASQRDDCHAGRSRSGGLDCPALVEDDRANVVIAVPAVIAVPGVTGLHGNRADDHLVVAGAVHLGEVLLQVPLHGGLQEI